MRQRQRRGAWARVRTPYEEGYGETDLKPCVAPTNQATRYSHALQPRATASMYSRARVTFRVGVERSSCGCVVFGRRGVLCVLLQGVGFPGLGFRFRSSAFVCL